MANEDQSSRNDSKTLELKDIEMAMEEQVSKIKPQQGSRNDSEPLKPLESREKSEEDHGSKYDSEILESKKQPVSKISEEKLEEKRLPTIVKLNNEDLVDLEDEKICGSGKLEDDLKSISALKYKESIESVKKVLTKNPEATYFTCVRCGVPNVNKSLNLKDKPVSVDLIAAKICVHCSEINWI